MATVVLTAVGSAIAGPIGGLVGSFLGASLDRAVFGGGSRGSGARVSDLAVQSSAYGEAIPRLYGHIRVAGNLIWSPGIKESASSNVGKRRSGTSYTYSASFAVALAARKIDAIGRIWADGKLLRNTDGQWIFPAVMRLHPGGEDQPADSLIIAVEGAARAPAYRGLTYVVFEDLPLADYGNRIPNLTFEVIADTANPDVLAIADDLAAASGVAPLRGSGPFPRVRGFAAASAGSLRSQIEPLIALADLSFADGATGFEMRSGVRSAATSIEARDLGAMSAVDAAMTQRRDTRGAGDLLPDSLAIGFYDPARDYQLGLQRAVRRSPAVRAEQRDLAVVLDAADAKALAESLICSAVAARCTTEVRVAWRHATIGVGDTIFIGTGAEPWRVRSRLIEGMIVRLDAERLPVAPRALSTATLVADAGRSFVADDQPNGPTLLQVMDLPPLPGSVPTTPRLWLAATGTGGAWRRAEIEVSADDGESYQSVATVAAAAVIGTAMGTLGEGPCDRWDHVNFVDVLLANDAMWLESRSEAAVLGGANLALVGDEIIHFSGVTAISPRRFRLGGLLRGRRGSDWAIADHGGDERFVVLDAAALVPFYAPVDAIGRELRFRAGASGADKAIASIVLEGRALRPLAPAQLSLATPSTGAVIANWVRRSRGGFAWIDGVDAPLSEERESYVILVRRGGVVIRRAVSDIPYWIYAKADRVADGAGAAGELSIAVAQTSSIVGPGDFVSATIAVAAA